jgi:hypothetical protein
MATAIQFGSKTKSRGAQLDPALKEFLDVVVIPALVKEYLLEHERENRLALVPDGVTHSAANDSASAEGVL